MNTTDSINNPLIQTLEARIPGETFRLPSQGIFYINGELSDDVKNGEVHVFPLTTIDEILLKTPDKLLSGQAIIDVFKHCIPQVLKPMELLSKDVEYLLMCLRLISYGEYIDVTYNHGCNTENENDIREYSVELRPLISNAKPIDPTKLTTKYTFMTKSDQKVILKPTVYGSVLKLYLSNFESSKLNEEDQFLQSQQQLIDIIVDTVVSVDGITNREQIDQWIRAIPAGYCKQVTDVMQDTFEWGASTTWTTTCKSCGDQIDINIPLNPISFFS